MNQRVYLETSIIGYVASRPSRDLVTASNQQLTRDWWDNRRHAFDLYASQFVVDECGDGDPIAANERLDLLKGVPLLEITIPAEELAETLMLKVPLPAKARIDALHISVATVHGMNYLLSWNCTHIANATLRPQIEGVCRALGYEPPTICTPQELLEA